MESGGRPDRTVSRADSHSAEILGRSVQWLIEGREEVFEVEDPDLRLFFRQYEWGDFTNEEQEVVRQGIKMAQAYRAARKQVEV